MPLVDCGGTFETTKSGLPSCSQRHSREDRRTDSVRVLQVLVDPRLRRQIRRVELTPPIKTGVSFPFMK